MRDDYTPKETAYWNGRADERKEWKDKIKAKIEEIDKILERNLLVDSLRDYFEAQKEVLQSLVVKE